MSRVGSRLPFRRQGARGDEERQTGKALAVAVRRSSGVGCGLRCALGLGRGPAGSPLQSIFWSWRGVGGGDAEVGLVGKGPQGRTPGLRSRRQSTQQQHLRGLLHRSAGRGE